MVYSRKNRYFKNWCGRIIVDTMDVEKSEEDKMKKKQNRNNSLIYKVDGSYDYRN